METTPAYTSDVRTDKLRLQRNIITDDLDLPLAWKRCELFHFVP